MVGDVAMGSGGYCEGERARRARAKACANGTRLWLQCKRDGDACTFDAECCPTCNAGNYCDGTFKCNNNC